LTAEILRKAVKTLFEAGYQLEAEALDSLKRFSETLNPEELVQCLLEILKDDGLKSPLWGSPLLKRLLKGSEERLPQKL
jgi:hypothetical protein